jgi:membrane protein required for colicin V production
VIADIVIVAVLLISGILALFRGMTRELLTIAGWVGAALATIYGFPQVRPLFAEFIADNLISDIACAATLFLVTLVVLTIASHLIANRIKGSSVGQLDHALGFVFGVLRGVILVSLVYIGATIFWDEKDFPDSIAEAKSLPLVQAAAGFLENFVPEDALPDRGRLDDPIGDAVEGVIEGAVEGASTAVEDAARKRLEAEMQQLNQPKPAGEADKESAGNATQEYSEAERREMQRLIENNQQERQ